MDLHRRILGDLLLAEHDAVLDEHVEGAVAHAVDAVGGMPDAVPDPSVAVQVLPIAARVLLVQEIAYRLQAVERSGAAVDQHAGSDGTRSLEKVPALELQHHVLYLGCVVREMGIRTETMSPRLPSPGG